MRPAVAGVVLGVAGALGMGRVIVALLYEVSPTDPLTLVGGSLIFLSVAALASVLPARRAALTPPAEALRGE